MALPGFTAETTLYKSTRHYATTASVSPVIDALVHPAVVFCPPGTRCCGPAFPSGLCTTGVCASYLETCCDNYHKCNWFAGERCCCNVGIGCYCCGPFEDCQYDPYLGLSVCTSGYLGGGGNGGGNGDGNGYVP